MGANPSPIAAEHREAAFVLLRAYRRRAEPFLLRSDLLDTYHELAAQEPVAALRDSAFGELVSAAQEATSEGPWLYLAVRTDVGRWRYLRCHAETLHLEAVTVSGYLAVKERVALGGRAPEPAWPLELDLAPFARELPRLKEKGSIGRGGEFLNRRLASQLFADFRGGLDRLFRFLALHSCQGRQLMINGGITSVEELRDQVRAAHRMLARVAPESTWAEVGDDLRGLGFEPGWGDTAARMYETLRLLQDLMEAPDPATFEALLARIPMVFRIAVVSPHGFFGQSGVMGLPDTGGQVVYILDQVRALEREMRRRLTAQGVDFEPQIAVLTRLIPDSRGTSCDQRLEPITGTDHARILRVPFRTASGEILPHWISRFEVWPYLERFAIEAEKELKAELGGQPDLIVGNYSDGNLVATLLAQRLGVTQFAIAHALEKSKYLFSDLYWHHNEDRYHFSCQFTADLVAMNTADCLITSTFQEIAGDEDSVGQYESYATFAMPGLLRVTSGIDVFDPRFNIVSPGVDPTMYFPYDDEPRRLRSLADEIESMLFAPDAADVRGRLEASDKPILLSMARLDRIKNLTGLVEWFGGDDRLRELTNLVVVAGAVDPAHCSDAEEREEAERLHHLMDEYRLDGQMRWIGRLLSKPVSGELYRVVADRRGAFVQPALFEAFGLTVLEAMTSGLPTFATRYGGPLEIIEDGVSGFHIDPNHGAGAAARMADFLARSAADPAVWAAVSEGAIARIRARYTWELYASRLMTLARVYGFWRYLTAIERTETTKYLQMLYNLCHRPRAAALDGGG